MIPCKLVSMALTIDLDHHPQLRAIEIYDVFVDGPLSQEGVAPHSASFQLLPEQYFSQDAILSESRERSFSFGS